MFRRREMLSAVAALPFAGLGGPAAADGASDLAGQLRFDAPDRLLEMFMRLSGSLDERLVIWWMEGTRYGVVDAFVTPLYGMKVGMFHRFFRQDDGSYRLAMFELTYYTDLDTGHLLESYRNPYTNAHNTVRHVRLGPLIRHQTVNGLHVDPPDEAVKDYWSRLGPATVHDGLVWIQSDVRARIELPSPKAPPIKINHYTTVLGQVADAENPQVQSAPASLAFQNILRWEPWMKMDDHPGMMMSRAAGRKLEDPASLPGAYLAMARKMHPRLIEDPVLSLERQVQHIRDGV